MQTKKAQLTVSFPEEDLKYKLELKRMQVMDSVNISKFILSCVKKEIGYIR